MTPVVRGEGTIQFSRKPLQTKGRATPIVRKVQPRRKSTINLVFKGFKAKILPPMKVKDQEQLLLERSQKEEMIKLGSFESIGSIYEKSVEDSDNDNEQEDFD